MDPKDLERLSAISLRNSGVSAKRDSARSTNLYHPDFNRPRSNSVFSAGDPSQLKSQQMFSASLQIHQWRQQAVAKARGRRQTVANPEELSKIFLELPISDPDLPATASEASISRCVLKMLISRFLQMP